MKRNEHFSRLKTNYLFPEITFRKKQFLQEHPKAQLISLGIGDTTEPIPLSINHALVAGATRLGTLQGYSGYGPEKGMESLRAKIAEKIYHGTISSDEVFISDGAKCDLGRLQTLFGSHVSIAVQDPSYPVYIDGSIIAGVKEIHLLPCSPENDFFPDLSKAPKTDLIYFCSPNNPTGAVATKKQLEQLVQFATDHESIILFDSAYKEYIRDSSLPGSIYEIDGAKKVAIEIGSFSKLVGFTGVRLGWSVVPNELKYEDGSSVKSDWNRLTSTIFNGASNISQWGGCGALEDQGLIEIEAMINYYLENVLLLKRCFERLGKKVYGGENAPYLWIHYPGENSWGIFQRMMEEHWIVTTPGSGFGIQGDEFIRVSAYGHREEILKAIERLEKKP